MRASILLVVLFGLVLTTAKLTSKSSSFNHHHNNEDSDNLALEDAENNLEEDDGSQSLVQSDDDSNNQLEEEADQGAKEGEDDGSSVPTKKPAAFEEEEEKRQQIVVGKVLKDAKAMSRVLEEADMDDDVKTAAVDDVHMIQADARELSSASPSRAHRLRQAIAKRMDALSLMLHSQEEEEAPNRIVSDAAAVRASVAASALSASHKSQANALIAQLTKNAKKFSSAPAHKKSQLKISMHSELEELKSIMRDAEEDANVNNNSNDDDVEAPSRSFEEEAVNRVESDIKAVRQSLKSAHLARAVKQDANKNLDAILRDAEEISSASAGRRHNLEKAMKLRLAALREQLGNH